MTIAAPAAANPLVMPSPIPALPPVMTATRPFKSKSFIDASARQERRLENVSGH
jgi:hypothetical protein